MDKFEALKAFTEVVKAGGFAAAARNLNTSRSSINKLVIQLENQLGVQLLYRTTRQVNPTESGLVFYDRCLTLLSDLAEAEQAMTTLQQEPQGILRLNAPMTFGTLHLTPLIARFMVLHPQLQVQLTLEDRLVDPIAEGYDLVVRITPEQNFPGVIVSPLFPIPQWICATPDYLARHGTPTQPQDLSQHNCLHYGYLSTGSTWAFKTQRDEPVRVSIKGSLCSNNGEVLYQAALKSVGIVLLPEFIVGVAIANGTLVPILQDYMIQNLTLSVVCPVNRHLSLKVRLFRDYLKQELSGLSVQRSLPRN